MTSSKIVGIAFTVLVAFSIACAVYIYVQQQRLQNASEASAAYQAEKSGLLNRLETDKGFREKLVDESLQHRKAVEALQLKLAANERALKAAKAAAQDHDATDPLGQSPEVPVLRERVSLLETTLGEQQKENDALRLALTKSDSEIDDSKKLADMESTRADQLNTELKRERRKKLLWGIAGTVIGAGLGFSAGVIIAH